MTRARTTADTQINTGGSVPPIVGGKNAVLNSAMDWWQYGTSLALSANTKGYTADRWKLYPQNNASTVSRQTTSDTTNLPFIQYCVRYQRNSGQTSTGFDYIAQSLESAVAIPFAGRTVTVSFYARSGANFSGSLEMFLYSGTGTDQNWIDVAYTGQATVTSGTPSLTSTWQRFTYTGTVASTATELALVFRKTSAGTAGAADYFEVTGVQLEAGSVATPFSRAAGTLQGELAACQRYYQVYGGNAVNEDLAMLMAYSTTAFAGSFAFLEMRTAPTPTIATASNFDLMNSSYSAIACTSIGASVLTKNRCQIYGGVASGLTAGNATELRARTTSGTIQLSAEL